MIPELRMLIAAVFGLAMPLSAWAIIVWQEKREMKRRQQADEAQKTGVA